LAEDLASVPGCTGVAEQMEQHLNALVGRLMFPGGLTAASRAAGAEPLVTGRARPYDESTLRKSAQRMERGGGVERVEGRLQAQVEQAVKGSGHPAHAHTDMYDQVFFTKKPSHAGPIGNLGNRLLAGTWFGLTFLRVEHGPVLGYHLSWHKPASPLVDALQELHQDEKRHAWLTEHLRLHTWDRGGNGKKVLQWSVDQGIPYLTVGQGWVYWSSQKRPTLFTAEQVPVFVKRDVRLKKGVPHEGTSPQPQVIVFPAHPDEGEACKRALCYPTNALLKEDEKATLNKVYKARWPEMENQIKALVPVGFRINRGRKLTLTTSRGVDGKQQRWEADIAAKETQRNALRAKPPTPQIDRKVKKIEERIQTLRARQANLAAEPVTKGARMPGGGELFCKNLLLLMYNTLAVILARSPIPSVAAMTPELVRALLLGRPAWTRIESKRITLWIDAVTDATQRSMQEELVRLFEEEKLRLRGNRLHIRLRQVGEKMSN
jgi:hypothetical protein